MVRHHNHAFWIYGVVVGLAIREALVKVVPHTIPFLAQAPPPSQPEPKDQLLLEAMRLVLFLAMTICYYLGSARYFDDVHSAADSQTTDPQAADSKTADSHAANSQNKFPRVNYSLDFLYWLIQFLLFFTWSQTLISHDRLKHGQSGFLVILGIILANDFIWLVFSWRYDSKAKIGSWAIINAIALLFSLLIFAAINWLHPLGRGEKTAEWAIGALVFLATLLHFGEMFGGSNVVTERLSEILPPKAVSKP